MEPLYRISEDVLAALVETSKHAADDSCFQSVSVVVLRISETAEGIKSNRRAFHELAHDACSLVYLLLCNERNLRGMVATNSHRVGRDLDHTKKELYLVLNAIYSFASEYAAHSRVKRALFHLAGKQRIRRYLRELKKLVNLLIITSNIALQGSIATLHQLHADMTTHCSATMCDDTENGHNINKEGTKDSPSDCLPPASPLNSFFPSVKEVCGAVTSVGHDHNNYMNSIVNSDSGNTSHTTTHIHTLNLYCTCPTPSADING